MNSLNDYSELAGGKEISKPSETHLKFQHKNHKLITWDHMQDPKHLHYFSLLLPVTVAAPLTNIRINMALTKVIMQTIVDPSIRELTLDSVQQHSETSC